MLNTDACQARVKSRCIIFSRPLENQFALHHVASAPSLNAQVPFTADQIGVAFRTNPQRGLHWHAGSLTFLPVLLLSLEIWEQPPGNAVFWICYIIPTRSLTSLGLNCIRYLMALGLIMGLGQWFSTD